jgi:hypothetical protein
MPITSGSEIHPLRHVGVPKAHGVADYKITYMVVGGIGRHGQAEGTGTNDQQLGVSRHR